MSMKVVMFILLGFFAIDSAVWAAWPWNKKCGEDQVWNKKLNGCIAKVPETDLNTDALITPPSPIPAPATHDGTATTTAFGGINGTEPSTGLPLPNLITEPDDRRSPGV